MDRVLGEFTWKGTLIVLANGYEDNGGKPNEMIMQQQKMSNLVNCVELC